MDMIRLPITYFGHWEKTRECWAYKMQTSSEDKNLQYLYKYDCFFLGISVVFRL